MHAAMLATVQTTATTLSHTALLLCTLVLACLFCQTLGCCVTVQHCWEIALHTEQLELEPGQWFQFNGTSTLANWKRTQNKVLHRSSSSSQMISYGSLQIGTTVQKLWKTTTKAETLKSSSGLRLTNVRLMTRTQTNVRYHRVTDICV